MRLIHNHPLDTQKLYDLFGESEDLLTLNPYTKTPFDPLQWAEWFMSEKSESYLFEKDGEIIGHTALRFYGSTQKVYLCFVYLKPEYRHKGLIYQMIQESHEIAQKLFKQPMIYLNVDSENLKAFNAYRKFGYKEDLWQGKKLSMVYFF